MSHLDEEHHLYLLMAAGTKTFIDHTSAHKYKLGHHVFQNISFGLDVFSSKKDMSHQLTNSSRTGLIITEHTHNDCVVCPFQYGSVFMFTLVQVHVQNVK